MKPVDKFAEASKLSWAIDSLVAVVRAMNGTVGYEDYTTEELETLRDSAVELIKAIKIELT